MQEQSGMICLAAGLYAILIVMFEKANVQGLNVQYEHRGVTRQPLPRSVL